MGREVSWVFPGCSVTAPTVGARPRRVRLPRRTARHVCATLGSAATSVLPSTDVATPAADHLPCRACPLFLFLSHAPQRQAKVAEGALLGLLRERGTALGEKLDEASAALASEPRWAVVPESRRKVLYVQYQAALQEAETQGRLALEAALKVGRREGPRGGRPPWIDAAAHV